MDIKIEYTRVKARFNTVDDKALGKALSLAVKKVKDPKVSTFTESNTGSYNSVPLPEVPHSVVSVTDGETKGPKVRLVHQQVICDGRNFKPPVKVDYLRPGDYEAWAQAVIKATGEELKKK